MRQSLSIGIISGNRFLQPRTQRDADAAYRKLLAAGATSVAPPFEIPIGRCAVVNDPFGNTLTVLDQSKGALTTNADGNVTGVLKR